MSRLRWWSIYLAVIACLQTVLALASALLGFPFWGFVIVGAASLLTSVILHVIYRRRNRNGRYRKALEAHRVGAGGGASDSAGTRGGPSGRTGAGMNPFDTLTEAEKRKLERLIGNSAFGNITITPRIPSQDPKPAIRPAGDFDGRTKEFAAGVVTGTRSFEVDKMGRLLGVAYKAVWKPGENVARCMVMQDPITYFTDGVRRGPRESSRPPHPLTECGHGFYGYYEGSNDYYEQGRVMGVVEGYGETVIGTRGFRVSKARIVALRIPAEVGVGRRRLIERNYAGIPVFESFDAMVAEFPPDDAGEGMSPETDPEFWTREA